jgi:putative transposase
MNNDLSLNHSRWECKYHVVWIPKYRRKALYGELRKYLGQVFKELARARECEVLEGHLMSDHVHMLISIPPKYSVSQVIGYIKGKSAIHIAQLPWSETQFHGAAVLGQGLPCIHRGS